VALDRRTVNCQKDVDARWTVKIGGKIRYRPDGTPLPQIATPVFGYIESWIKEQSVGSPDRAASKASSKGDRK
jgi:hypothetical protein